MTPSHNSVAHTLTTLDIGPLGATVRWLNHTLAHHAIKADRLDILNAARSLDWRVVGSGADEVVLPPPGKPIKLSGWDD